MNLCLLRRLFLGSRSTLSPPHSLSGTPQTHTHQHHHCQHATPYSSHPSTDNNTLKNFFLSFRIAQVPVFLLFFFLVGFLSPLSLSHTQTQKECINRQGAGDKQCEREDGLLSYILTWFAGRNKATLQCCCECI